MESTKVECTGIVKSQSALGKDKVVHEPNTWTLSTDKQVQGWKDRGDCCPTCHSVANGGTHWK